MKQLLLAQYVAPMVGDVIRDGAVAFDAARVLAVGGSRQLRSAHPDAELCDLGGSVLLPGLVNAHTHLELSDARPAALSSDADAGTRFVEWLKERIRAARAQAGEMDQTVPRAVRGGVAQCLRFGVTTVGDISKQCHLTRPELRDGPLRIVSYGEVQSMGRLRGMLEARLDGATDNACESERLRIGITPHAPYTVEIIAYARCLHAAGAGGLPLATHLAETAAEAEFLGEHRGPFRDLWDWLGAWDEDVPRFEGGPIRLAEHLGLLEYRTLLAHVNYCDDEELALLARGNASVVWCPRTHAYFGHAPHRWRDMLARGINVAVGTDSCASSPDLNLVDDLRLLHHLSPQTPAAELWEMATVRAARALGLDQEIGTIAPGRRADFVAFEVRTEDPLTEILRSSRLPNSVWIDGRRR